MKQLNQSRLRQRSMFDAPVAISTTTDQMTDDTIVETVHKLTETTPVIDKNEQHLPNKETLVRYPKWCETMCAAWSHYRGACNGEVMGRELCKWNVADVERRIIEKKKMNGNSWWR